MLGLALVLVLGGCQAVVEAGDAGESSSSDGSDELPSDVREPEPDPSMSGPVDDGSDSAGDDEGDSPIDDSGLAPDPGESSGDEAADDGSVAPEDLPCLDVADCIVGQPFALGPCAAEYDVSPTQCGYIPPCAREIAWIDDVGKPVPPPTELEVGYSHGDKVEFHSVDHACYAPGDGMSCVVPCHGQMGALGPVKMMRVTYTCAGSTISRTYVNDVAALDGTLVLHC
jgi:hypothetical protein